MITGCISHPLITKLYHTTQSISLYQNISQNLNHTFNINITNITFRSPSYQNSRPNLLIAHIQYARCGLLKIVHLRLDGIVEKILILQLQILFHMLQMSLKHDVLYCVCNVTFDGSVVYTVYLKKK